MNSCHHVGWFYLSGRESFHLHYGNRAANVIREMSNPDSQCPSLVFFIGGKCKSAALPELFPHNNLRRGTREGAVNLRLDSSSFASDFPLLIADGDPKIPIPHRLGPTMCHEQKTIPLGWASDRQQNIRLILYARLVALFSDVVCIFADDFGGLTGVAEFLIQWVRMGAPSSLPLSIRPRVVIVARKEETAVTHNILEIEDLRMMLRQEGQETYAQVFSSISLMHLGGDHVSPLARHRRLKEVILLEVDVSRRERIERRVHFSATHFEAFFHGAVQHLAKSIDEPFNFIGCTRLCNPIEGEYRDHIATFVSLSNESFLPYESVVSFIASSILMDAYPPRMHGKCSADPYGENCSHSQCSILERYFGDCIKHTVSRPSRKF